MTLEEAINQGYINQNKHPELPLYIYNYTQEAQSKYIWNDVTINNRGRITDLEGNTLYAGFTKFFNYNEEQAYKLTSEPLKVYNKLDGSLGILYWYEDTPYIATRGSFSSEQAIYATNVLLPQYIDYIKQFDKSNTYLFEIIYPDNQIVVDYGEQERLVLLACLSDEGELNIDNIDYPDKIEEVNYTLEEMLAMDVENQEGFVIVQNGNRVKVKFDNYVRLHRILTGVTKGTIYKGMMYDMSPEQYKEWEKYSYDKMMEAAPDEAYDFIEETSKEIKQNFADLIELVDKVTKETLAIPEGKELAMFLKQNHPKIMGFVIQNRMGKLRQENLLKHSYESNNT